MSNHVKAHEAQSQGNMNQCKLDKDKPKSIDLIKRGHSKLNQIILSLTTSSGEVDQNLDSIIQVNVNHVKLN